MVDSGPWSPKIHEMSDSLKGWQKNKQTNKPAKDQEGNNDNDVGDDASGVEVEFGGECKLFACPNEGFVKTYQRYRSTINHTLHGQWVFQTKGESLFDTAKMLYN